MSQEELKKLWAVIDNLTKEQEGMKERQNSFKQVLETISSTKESSLKSKNESLFRCKGDKCGYTTNDPVDMIVHYTNPIQRELKTLNEKLNEHANRLNNFPSKECINGICDEVGRRYKLTILKEERKEEDYLP